LGGAGIVVVSLAMLFWWERGRRIERGSTRNVVLGIVFAVVVSALVVPILHRLALNPKVFDRVFFLVLFISLGVYWKLLLPFLRRRIRSGQ